MSRKKLIILIVICLLVSFAYWYAIIFLIIPEIFPPEPFPILKGELIYLKNESAPNNTAIGVWIEVILEEPKRIKYGDWARIRIVQNKKLIASVLLNSSVIHTENNITIEHMDWDNDSHLSSHDRFHIYGCVLTNSRIILYSTRYYGQLTVDIP